MEKGRLIYLDNAKALLIVMMVFAHIWQAGYVHDFIYTFHMGAFFVINGIQLVESSTLKKSYKDFVLSRLYTMGIPFIFFEIWACITYLVRYGNGQNIKGFIYNTVTLNFNNGVNWFLFTLMVAQLFIPFIIKFLCRMNDWWGYCITVLFIMSGIYLRHNDSQYIVIIAREFFVIGLILIGYLYKNSSIYGKSINTRWLALTFLIVVAVSRFMKPVGGVGGMDFGNPTLAIIGICAGTLMVLQIGQLNLPAFVQWIGQNTLIIFGTHNTWYVSIGHALGITDFTQTDFLRGSTTFVLVVIIEVLLIYIMNKYFPFLVGKRIRNN